MPRSWVRLPVMWLHDYNVAALPDDKWRAVVETYINDPKNIHYETSPERYSWLRVRKQRSKEIYSRDEHKCKYCGSTNKLEIDHIIPLAMGGSNDLDNLQILCKKCNRKKWKYMP